MAIDTVKLINYLAYEVSPSQIAAALGITPSRVTQLATEAQVLDLVQARKAELASQDAERQANLTDARATLLSSIMELAKDTESLGEAVRAYEVLDKLVANGSARDGEAVRSGSSARTLVVQVPIFVQQALSLEKDSKNQIVEIAGRSMATMPTVDTYRLLKEQPEQLDDPSPDSNYEW